MTQLIYLSKMKSFYLLLSLTWLGTLFAQNTHHILIKSNGSVHITDPICKKMAEESKKETQVQIAKMRKLKKGYGRYNNVLVSLEQQSYLEAMVTLAEDPENNFAGVALSGDLIKTYRKAKIHLTAEETTIYLSLQKVSLKSLGEASLEISINDVQVSSSETAMDIVVKSLRNPNAPNQTMHFSCATADLLIDLNENKLAWLNYLGAFYNEVKAMEWLEKAIMQVDPTLISKTERAKQVDETLAKLGLTNEEYLSNGIQQTKDILKGHAYKIPFDDVIAVLISKDQNKICLLQSESLPGVGNSEFEMEKNDSYELFHVYTVTLQRMDDKWDVYYLDNETNTPPWSIREFYQAAITSDNQFNEEQWINEYFNKRAWDAFYHLEVSHVTSSPEMSSLIAQEIQPKLAKLYNEQSNTYINFYQRISPELKAWWRTEEETITVTDILISNPEKTAFIYPVLLLKEEREKDSEYIQKSEDFKFFILLKNQDGSYTLYDWYYFNPMQYTHYYELMNCVASHLNHHTNYIPGQEVIDDQSFWDNYVFKRNQMGLEYLTPVVMENESIFITKAEFDAQVNDCIDLMTEHDLVDLYDHQLKQIIRCINTIQKGNMSGANHLKLVNLSQELHFQNRLNRMKEMKGNFVPSLQLELGQPLLERSYYQIH